MTNGFSHSLAVPENPVSRFGEQIPFGDPYWYQGLNSPYYDATHLAWREKCRKFVDAQVIPFVDEWEEAGVQPPGLLKKLSEEGLLSAVFPTEVGGKPPESFDIFHELILIDEMARCGSWGVIMGCYGIMTMALPPVIIGCRPSVRDRVARACVAGDKQIGLAISEPWAGSDVAGMRTEARREGDFYIVNGQKKWITNAVNASFFTLACRTGNVGKGGISLLLVERDTPGIKVEKMKLQGNWTAGTGIVTLEDVRVPAENLIGEENKGFKMIVKNFNHERFVIAAVATRAARVCLEESVRHARRRKTFGKRLADHQVIKHKLADMARAVESLQAWLELVAYQMKTGAPDETVGQMTALIKAHASKVYKQIALEACQVLGGSSYVRGGNGAKVERAVREIVSASIPGGSEEILLDLGMDLAKL